MPLSVSSSGSCSCTGCPLILSPLITAWSYPCFFPPSIATICNCMEVMDSDAYIYTAFSVLYKSLHIWHLCIFACLHKTSIHLHRGHMEEVYQRFCIHSLIQFHMKRSARCSKMGSFVLKRFCNFSTHLVVPSLGMWPWSRMPCIKRGTWFCATSWTRGWNMSTFQNLVRQMLDLIGTFQVIQKKKYLYPVLPSLYAVVFLRVAGAFQEHCVFCGFLFLFLSVPLTRELQ